MRITGIRSAVAAAGLIVGLSAVALAGGKDAWPQRPVRIVVPVGVGSGPDVAARMYAQRLAALWNRPVVVENRGGADGLIGVLGYANMRDDHALLFSPAAPITVFPYTHENLGYDAARDFVPISTAASTFGAIAVPVSLNVRSLDELVALARGEPGKLNWASGGGAFPILLRAFAKSAGLQMVEVSYREQNVALQDLAEGRVQIIATTLTPLLPLVDTGKIRLLAVTNKLRAPVAPQVPTAMEAGYSDLAFEGLIGFFGWRDMPPGLRDRLAADIATASADPVLVERLTAAGQVVHTSAPAVFAKAIEEQRAHNERLVTLVKGNH